MLSALAWLHPDFAPAVLKTTSNLLKGEVPSPAERLVAALKSATAADTAGTLSDASLREKVGAGLQTVGEISDGSAAALVDAFVTVLEAQAKDIRGKASKLEKSLPKKAVPSFKEVADSLPKGQEPSKVLKTDWLVWHSMGHAYDAKALPPLTEKVLRERVALAACVGEGAVGEALMGVQILDNLDAYVAWELSVPASKVPKTGLEVLQPFADKQAKEVATRRVLLQAGLPSDVAAKVAAKSVLGIGPQHALKELAAEAKKLAVLPLYVAPPAPKDTAGGKQKGDAKAGGKQQADGGKKQAGGVAAKPPASGAVPAGAGSLGAFYSATATQELQWALLSYQLHPRTLLSAAAAPGASTATSGVPAKAAGFAGTWSDASPLPPGHTKFSWDHVQMEGMTKGSFATTWVAPEGSGILPPGHTPYSWQKALGSGSAAGSAPATSSTTPPAAAANPKQPAKAAGFAGTWSDASPLPPGHTKFSWDHVQMEGMTKGSFATTWVAPEGSGILPPGHTPYSWQKALGSGSAAGSAPATSSTTPPAAAANPEKPAKTSKGGAVANGAVAANGAAAVNGAGPASAPAGPEEEALAKLDIRCGKIMECGRVPDADSLYLLKIDIGDAQPRQVVSSLVKHYTEDQLVGRQVVVYCNIKPGKMRGFESQAMILAATQDKGAENEKCELATPPKGAKEGTRMQVGPLQAGSASEGVSTKNISKVWAVVQPLLQVNPGKEATFKGTTITFPQGPVTTASLTGCGIY